MEKKLNLFDLTSIGVGCIVGSGVFALMGVGIGFTGRGITFALFIAMALCVLQSITLPLISRIFEVEGGEYTINSLICPLPVTGFSVGRDIIFRAGAQAVTALAMTQYLSLLFPALAAYTKGTAIAVMTLAFVCAMAGDKVAAQVQNVMCIFMYAALGLFVIFGVAKINPSAYAGEPMFPMGVKGLVLAVALMSYTCNGFQYVVNMGKSAKNSTRNIPLAFFLSAFVGAIVYSLIGFSATHVYSFSTIKGMNLGGVAEMMMPRSLYLFFLIGGAIFALATSMVGGIISGYRPLMACAKDGWLPAALAKRTRKGDIPYIYGVLYLISVIPILVGLDLGDVATICLFPGAIQKVLVNIYALAVPNHFKNAWVDSGIKLPIGIYRLLLAISSAAAIILGIFYFTSNGQLKVTMILVTVIICIYAVLCSQFGHIEISAQKEYAEGKTSERSVVG